MIKYRNKPISNDVPRKANRILYIILIAIIIIIIRLWFLAEIQYDQRVEEAKKPQRKIVLEAAKRGTIRDRFNIPLAINKIQYQVGVVYAELRHIPRIKWEIDAAGKKVKRYKRQEYIKQLAQLLAQELKLEANYIEDLIHAKATFYYQVPFIIKDDVNEEVYYKLNMLVKDWPGLYVQRKPKRFYLRDKLAADIIGYMGAINRDEYDRIMGEIEVLRSYVEAEENGEIIELPEGIKSPQEVRRKLKELEDHAYAVSDYVGKSGVEAKFEFLLRGYHGKKCYYSDARGNFLRELPGSQPPLSGQRLLLTISAELQEYAEQLLAKNEKIRKIRTTSGDSHIADPWIKGGAIIAMDPNSGEILTMATFPRFNPNDFITSNKKQEVLHWFETESYLADIWDQKLTLEREVFKKDTFEIEKLPLTWKNYLNIILPEDSPVRISIRRNSDLQSVILLQRQIERLLQLSGQSNLYRLMNLLYTEEEGHKFHGNPSPAHIKALITENLIKHDTEITKLKTSLNRWFQNVLHNYDKVLLVDLCRMMINSDQFDDHLLVHLGTQSLADYREVNGAIIVLKDEIRDMMCSLFHELYFIPWRQEKGNQFIKEKRAEEKEKKIYAKPYIDYFEKKEKEMFEEFWQQYQWRFLTVLLKGKECITTITPYDQHLLTWRAELEQGAHVNLSWKQAYHCVANTVQDMPYTQVYAYLKTFRSFAELNRPLYGRYRYLKRQGKQQLEKHLAMAFYPTHGYGNARSYAYRQATPQGSLFKLVTAYAGLIQRYEELDENQLTQQNLNPLTLTDQPFKSNGKQFMGYFANGNPIPQLYKGGKLMKSMISNVGKVDIIHAIETSSNPYFSLIAGEVLKDPFDLVKAAKLLSYGAKTGIDLPLEIKGRIPDDIDLNRTGLYSMACGQHTLVVTPLQTCVMLATFANGGQVLKPNIVRLSAGSVPTSQETLLQWKPNFQFRENLNLIGIDFPLFTTLAQQYQTQMIQNWPPRIKEQIKMPKMIQDMILEGMKRVVQRQTNQGLGPLTQLYKTDPTAVRDLLELKNELAGKTSTAESMENLNLDLFRGTNKYNHVWFGGISFEDDKPELVVVIFLKYGAFGKEAAPIAAQIVKKWREIKAKHSL